MEADLKMMEEKLNEKEMKIVVLQNNQRETLGFKTSSTRAQKLPIAKNTSTITNDKENGPELNYSNTIQLQSCSS